MSLENQKALIKKYLDGQCSPEELKQVRAILKKDDAQQLFDQIWDEEWAYQINPRQNNATSQQQQRWKQMLDQRIFEDASVPTPQIKPFYQRNQFWRYAAVWLVLILGVAFWQVSSKKETTVEQTFAFTEMQNPKGQRTQIILPDSSIVYLGAMSKIRFAKKFASNIREVALEGEAFFEVTKNPKKPFIIHTGNISTQVLGTSFKIDAFAGQPIKVLVSTGKVRVDRHINHQIQPIAMLLPGEMVTWNENTAKKVLANVDVTEVTGWKDGKLHFDETKLADIAKILERWYNVNIEIANPTLAKRLIKVNLTTNISIVKIMNILSVAGDFHYQINGKEIHINNKERKTM